MRFYVAQHIFLAKLLPASRISIFKPSFRVPPHSPNDKSGGTY